MTLRLGRRVAPNLLAQLQRPPYVQCVEPLPIRGQPIAEENRMSNRTFKLLVAIVVASSMLALSAATVTAASQRAFVAKVTMTGDQEVLGAGEDPTCAPPDVCGDPDATGTARIWIIPARDVVCWELSWADVDGDVVGAHIHGPADTAHAAPVLVPLSVDPASGCVTLEANEDGVSLADTIAADPSMYYVNVHSTVFPGGAIRAQLG
jgi:hypothetical protein